jgi:RNA polymerase sigma-70 factor (ECF subfamily)
MNNTSGEQTSVASPDPGPAGVSESARLVQAISAGNLDAEREFATRYLPPVRAMLLARLRDPDVADDLKQDVLIESICALRRGRIQDPEKLSQFVMGIARNCLNNYFRSSHRVALVDLPENLPAISSTESDRDERDREQRAILQMTLVDGLKPGIIAEQLHLSPDVVRQRKLRATRRVIDFIRRQSQIAFPSHISAGRAR